MATDGGPDGAAWDELVSRLPDATVFHRMAWQRSVGRTFGYKPRLLAARRNGRISGVLPLFLVPLLPWGRALISSPQAVYGGPIGEDDETRRELCAEAERLSRSLGAKYVEYRNLEPIPNLPAKDLYVTFRRAILPTADENMAIIPKNQRRSIRIALKSGLTSDVGREELLDAFYALYAYSVRNLGTPVFPKSLFANLLAEYGDDCRILVVRRDKRPVAAVLTLFFRDQVLPYYAGSRREEFRNGVNDYMYWALLIYGMEHGYKVFDFGRSKKGSGSYDFKRHWGFEPIPLHYQYQLVGQQAMPDLSPKNPKFSVAIEAWKRMPLWMSVRLGPWLVRYFP
ncbi:MAG: FemAB family XrtA/PEP-CTERM system-associated protein [Candidatus Eiseniibacteriota bacterium]